MDNTSHTSSDKQNSESQKHLAKGSFYRWLQNHRALTIVTLCILLALVLGIVLTPALFSRSKMAAAQSPTAVVATSTPTHFPPSATNVTYHGGPVQLSPNTYLIFWGKEWQSNAALQTTKQSLESYFQHVGGSSYERVLTQYYMQNPNGSRAHITNTAHFASNQSWVDPTEPTADSQSCPGPTISDHAVKLEIAHALATTHWQRDDKNVTYFVYTPPSFAVYEPGWGCSGQDLCGDHEWAPDMPGLHISYAVLPYPDLRCRHSSTSNTVNTDELVNASAHEQFESITDPTPGRADDTAFKNEGWFYVDAHKQAEEIGDLCYREFSPQTLNGVTFNLQKIWSNQANGCV